LNYYCIKILSRKYLDVLVMHVILIDDSHPLLFQITALHCHVGVPPCFLL
jgi:hypothetical protein